MKLSWISATALAGSLIQGANGASQAQVPLGQPKTHNPFTKDFAKLANETMHKHRTPGIAIAVIDGHDIYTQGFGYASLPDTPATPDTLWCAGSTTKAFTAATISHLIHQDRHPSLQPLGWATPISSILGDDFVLESDWATRHVTLNDAVSHRTGLSRHDMSYSIRHDDGTEVTLRDSVRKIRHLPLYEEPRVIYQYCNLMYMVLSHVVETLTGEWLGDVMRGLIWKPLGMNSTFFGYDDMRKSEVAAARMADAYFFDPVEEEYKKIPPMGLEGVSGAGAILSSANDYARWVHALLHKGDPFSEEVHRDIRTPRIMDQPNGESLYGLAWSKEWRHGHRQYSHNGGTDGFGTNVYWYPDEGYGVVAFGNTALQSHDAENELLFSLIDARLGVNQEEVSAENDRDSQRSISQSAKNPYGCDYDEGADMLFPNRPQPPVSPPTNVSNLAGSYHHPGYGTLNFTAESIPGEGKASEQVRLVAKRPFSPWRYQLDLRHVSGSFFLTCMSTLNPEMTLGWGRYRKAEFRVDVSGKAKGLWIDVENKSDKYPQANIWFARVE